MYRKIRVQRKFEALIGFLPGKDPHLRHVMLNYMGIFPEHEENHTFLSKNATFLIVAH